MVALAKHGILHYVPVRPVRETKGLLPGMTVEGLRDERDRL
jgi:hypothetical protein